MIFWGDQPKNWQASILKTGKGLCIFSLGRPTQELAGIHPKNWTKTMNDILGPPAHKLAGTYHPLLGKWNLARNGNRIQLRLGTTGPSRNYNADDNRADIVISR